MQDNERDDLDSLMDRVAEFASGNPAVQRQIPRFREIVERQRKSRDEWVASFESYFSQHPAQTIPDWYSLSLLERAQSAVALEWANSELGSLKGNTVLTGDAPSVAAMQQVLEARSKDATNARLLLRPDWTRFQEWRRQAAPRELEGFEPEGYVLKWHQFEPVNRAAFGQGKYDTIPQRLVDTVASAPGHVLFFKRDHGYWYGSLAAGGYESLWRFEAGQMQLVEEMSMWNS